MWHRKCSWGCLNSGALWEEGLVKEQGSTLALPLQACLLLLLPILSQWVLKGRDFHARPQPFRLPCSAQACFLGR